MKNIIRHLLICITLFLIAAPAWATHYEGAEITYTSLGGCSYRIIVTNYIDCDATVLNPGVPLGTVSFQSLNGCASTMPVALGGWVVASNEEVTPIAPSVIPNGTVCSGLPGATMTGVRQVVFTRDYDFCGISCPIQISMQACCRNGNLNNINTSISAEYAVHANMLDPTIGNHSPQWLDPSYMILDIGSAARISMAAYDEDGDSLVYQIDSIFTTPGNIPQYNPGFWIYQPLGTSVGHAINPETGDLLVQPGFFIGEYAVGISMLEYRDGNLIGFYSRDLTVTALPGLSNPDYNPYVLANGGAYPTPVGGTYVDSFTVQAFAGVTLELPIQGLDYLQAGDSVMMTWSQNLPGAVFSDYNSGTPADTIEGVNPVGLLRWTPPAAGRYAFNVKLEDSSQYALGLADFSFVITVGECDLMSDFGTDTVLICLGDTATLSAAISGGTPPYQYSWSTGETTASISTDTTGYFFLEVYDANNCMVMDTVYVDYSPYCVWPGDADNDGVAHNFDLLAIGQTYGDTGPLRPGASLNWVAQMGSEWTTWLSNGYNAVFTDSDGNGTINDDDTLAISLNYGLIHNKGQGVSGGAGDPPLFLLASSDSVMAGDTLLLSVMLGVDTLLATDVYGMALSIQYDATLVDSATAHISYQGWLGTPGTDLIGLQKDAYSNGQIDMAITRIDQQNNSGYGAVASLSIVMIDDIAGKTAVSEILQLDITDVRIISLDGTEIPVDVSGTQVVVSNATNTGLPPELGTQLLVYPQPARDQVIVALGKAQDWQLSLLTLSGQEVLHYEVRQAQSQLISLDGLSSGLYLLRVRNQQGQQVQKLQIVR